MRDQIYDYGPASLDMPAASTLAVYTGHKPDMERVLRGRIFELETAVKQLRRTVLLSLTAVLTLLKVRKTT
jgi:hypothetical protein